MALLVIATVGFELASSHPGSGRPATGRPAAAARSADARAAVAVGELSRIYSGVGRSWQEATALDAIIQYMQETGSRAYLPEVTATYRDHLPGSRYPGFLDGYYDDEGWWALTWIRAYDLTRNRRYLNVAKVIFANLTTGWTSACGGGVLWKKGQPYKDAIANELFLQVAAKLHARTPGDTRYRRWAVREWHWFRHTGMIGKSGLVLDGLAPDCQPLPDSPRWTYNQGGLIAGLADLEQITHRRSLLRTAEKTAGAVIHSPALSPGGILHEPSCPVSRTCQHDAPTFKGVFAQNLRLLYRRVGRPPYLAYLARNADSLWTRDRRGATFGMHWAGPFDRADIPRQVAAVDLLNTQVTADQAGTAPAAASPGPTRGPVP